MAPPTFCTSSLQGTLNLYHISQLSMHSQERIMPPYTTQLIIPDFLITCHSQCICYLSLLFHRKQDIALHAKN